MLRVKYSAYFKGWLQGRLWKDSSLFRTIAHKSIVETGLNLGMF